jgi:hypothetical protein
MGLFKPIQILYYFHGVLTFVKKDQFFSVNFIDNNGLKIINTFLNLNRHIHTLSPN